MTEQQWQRQNLLSTSLLPKCLQQTQPAQAKARSLEFNLCLLWLEGPDQLSHRLRPPRMICRKIDQKQGRQNWKQHSNMGLLCHNHNAHSNITLFQSKYLSFCHCAQITCECIGDLGFSKCSLTKMVHITWELEMWSCAMSFTPWACSKLVWRLSLLGPLWDTIWHWVC